MEECFAAMDATWLEQMIWYTGSITNREKGIDFRYRFKLVKDEPALMAATYSDLCYEKASNVEERKFDLTEAGAQELKLWYQSQYEAYCNNLK